MMRRLLPLLAAIALVAFFFGPGRQYLPAGLRLQTDGSLVTDTEHDAMDHGTPSGIGLAPAPVTNPRPTAARLTVAAAPLERTERGYALNTTVVGPDGRPVADATVKFYELVDLFGTREMFIGQAITDGRGIAAITYLPARTGGHDMVVRYAGREKVSAGEGRMTFNATVAAPQPKHERSALASFSDRVPYAAGLIVLGVWLLIGIALISTARGVIGGARGHRGKEELA